MARFSLLNPGRGQSRFLQVAQNCAWLNPHLSMAVTHVASAPSGCCSGPESAPSRDSVHVVAGCGIGIGLTAFWWGRNA